MALGVGCGAAATGGDCGAGAGLPQAAPLATAAIAMTARVQVRTCLATSTPLVVSSADEQTVAEFSYTL